jgi:hypothetical protein
MSRSSWIKPAWPPWTSKTKKELSCRSSRNPRPPTVIQEAQNCKEFRRIFQPHFRWDRFTHRAQQIVHSRRHQERSWTEKLIGDGFRNAGQETDRTFEETILELRAFCGQESAGNRGESLLDYKATSLDSRNCSKNESNPRMDYWKNCWNLRSGGTRQASRKLTRKNEISTQMSAQ